MDLPALMSRHFGGVLGMLAIAKSWYTANRVDNMLLPSLNWACRVTFDAALQALIGAATNSTAPARSARRAHTDQHEPCYDGPLHFIVFLQSLPKGTIFARAEVGHVARGVTQADWIAAARDGWSVRDGTAVMAPPGVRAAELGCVILTYTDVKQYSLTCPATLFRYVNGRAGQGVLSAEERADAALLASLCDTVRFMTLEAPAYESARHINALIHAGVLVDDSVRTVVRLFREHCVDGSVRTNLAAWDAVPEVTTNEEMLVVELHDAVWNLRSCLWQRATLVHSTEVGLSRQPMHMPKAKLPQAMLDRASERRRAVERLREVSPRAAAVLLAHRVQEERMAAWFIVVDVSSHVLRVAAGNDEGTADGATSPPRPVTAGRFVEVETGFRGQLAVAPVLLHSAASTVAINVLNQLQRSTRQRLLARSTAKLKLGAFFAVLKADTQKITPDMIRSVAEANATHGTLQGFIEVLIHAVTSEIRVWVNRSKCLMFGVKAPLAAVALLAELRCTQALQDYLDSLVSLRADRALNIDEALSSTSLLDPNAHVAFAGTSYFRPRSGMLSALLHLMRGDDPEFLGGLRLVQLPHLNFLLQGPRGLDKPYQSPLTPQFGLALLFVARRDDHPGHGLPLVACHTLWPSTPTPWAATIVLPTMEALSDQCAARCGAEATARLRLMHQQVEEEVKLCYNPLHPTRRATPQQTLDKAKESAALRARVAFMTSFARSSTASVVFGHVLGNYRTMVELRYLGAEVALTSTAIALAPVTSMVMQFAQGSRHGLLPAALDRMAHSSAAAYLRSLAQHAASAAIHATSGANKLKVDQLAVDAARTRILMHDPDTGLFAGVAGVTATPPSNLTQGLATALQHLTVTESLPRRIDRREFESKPLPLRGALPFSVTFDSVSFAYPDDPEVDVLRNVSFHVPAGQHCAVVGRSGSGKTTLIILLLRMFEPREGRILIDGVDVRELPPRWLRRRLAMVTQHCSLLPTLSLEDNLRVAAPLSTHVDRQVALGRAQARTFVKAVGGRSTDLSGGERQRVVLSRAFARLGGRGCERPGLALLDEATSALDVETERAVLHSLDLLRVTRLTVAHRYSTIASADIVVVLDDGQVVETGSYAGLSRSPSSAFRALLQQQHALSTPAIRSPAPSTPSGESSGESSIPASPEPGAVAPSIESLEHLISRSTNPTIGAAFAKLRAVLARGITE